MDRVAKERLINDDSVARNHTVSSGTQLTTCWRSLIILLTFINIIACVTACICAGYCYNTTLTKESIQETSTVKPDIGTTVSVHAHENFREYIEIVPTDSVEYVYDDDYYNEDDYDEDSYDNDDYNDDDDDDDDDNEVVIDYDYSVDDEDSGLESSGYGAEEAELDKELKSNNDDLLKKPSNRKRRSVDNDCVIKCQEKRNKKRCLKKCMKRNNTNKNKKGKNIRKDPMSIDIPAAHFEAGFTDYEVKNKVQGQYDSYRHTKVCKYIPELEGTLCLNRSFIPSESMAPLRIFQKSSWYDENKSPVTFVNSVVTAKSGGIYFVYAQAYIDGTSPTKSIAVVQKRNGKTINQLRCDNGVNAHVSNTQLQTCSVTGLMQLSTSDTIEIQASKPDGQVRIQKDMTYFGLVKLSGDGENSKHKSD